jgi:hypothetical protein
METYEGFGLCLRCGMNPKDFYGKNKRKQGILCDFKIDNGAHLWELGCTCTKQPHTSKCAFFKPKEKKCAIGFHYKDATLKLQDIKNCKCKKNTQISIEITPI